MSTKHSIRRAANRGARSLLDALEPRRLFYAPSASLTPPATVTNPGFTVDLTVTYTDDQGVDPATLGVGNPATPSSTADLTITGPNGFSADAVYLGSDDATIRSPRVATYRLIAPEGRFDAADNGLYSVAINTDAVQDNEGLSVPAAMLGTFTVDVPVSTGGLLNEADGAGTDFAVEAMDRQPDGKIVAAGFERYARESDPNLGEDPGQVVIVRRDVIRRFNADGSVDTTFGTNGRTVSAAGVDSAAHGVLVQPDGTILVASERGFPASDFTLTRYTAGGALDTNFGDNGVVIVDFSDNFTGSDVPLAIARQSDGKILLAGRAQVDHGGNINTDFALARLNADGSPDSGFGTAGRVTTALSASGDDGAGSILIGSDGKIVLAGMSGGSPALVRYTTAGALDTTFDGDGKLVLSGLLTAGGDDFRVGLAERRSAGTSQSLYVAASTSDRSNFALVRLNYSNGGVDSAFGGGSGIITYDLDGSTEDADAIAALPNGFLIAGTTRASGGTVQTAAVVIDAAGALDATYGNGGKVRVDPILPTGAIPLRASAIVDGSSGAAVLARNDGGGSSTLRRITADTAAPTATLAPVADVTTSTNNAVTLNVTFADNNAVKVSTIAAAGGSAISVTGPNGGTPLAVTLVGVDSDRDGSPVVATYSVAGPGGSFRPGDNGSYTVAIDGALIADATGSNFVPAGTLGAFAAAIVPGAPTAALTPVATLTVAGGSTQTFAVTYTDDDAVDASTIDVNDVTVTGPGGGTLNVTDVSFSGSGPQVVATYSVAAPNGVWGPSDNGIYSIALAAGQVIDASGNPASAASLGGYEVFIADTVGNGIPLGQFGIVTGIKKPQKLVVADIDGTTATLTLKGGTGSAYMQDGRVALMLSGTTPASTLTLKGGKEGDGRLAIGSIAADGGLRSVTAKTGDVAGLFSITGDVRTVTLGVVSGTLSIAGAAGSISLASLSGTLAVGGSLRTASIGAVSGTLAAGGAITSLTIGTGGATNAKLLSGTTLGADLALGGSGSDTDGYGSGPIGKIVVKGTANSTIFAASLNPINGAYLDGDDQVGSGDSVIRSITVKGGVDDGTHFAASGFGKVTKIPRQVDPAADAHFLDL